MKRLLLLFTFLAIGIIVPAFAENSSVVNVHVEKAVAVPGRILQPGDYIFRLVNPDSSLRAVAISSADSKTVYGIIPVYQAQRDYGAGNEIRELRAEGDLGRIDSWFFPGQTGGYRFIYSKSDINKANMYAQQMKSRGTVQQGQ